MLEYLINDKYVDKSDRIAVGVSGGADSMLLLCALVDKQRQVGFDLTVIHINHQLRETADRDENFVQEFCKKRKIKCYSVKINIHNCKETEKMTIEEAARFMRYEEFDRIMKKENANKLFLAHHKNDQAETILMHIFRGSGIAGACGIRQTDKIIRPLLNLTKIEILNLCKEHSIGFVEDETNKVNDYARNYLRNEIIPQIEIVYPGVVDAIFKFGIRCEELQTYIESLIDDDMIAERKDEIILKQSVFEKPTFLIREYIKKVFAKLKIFDDIESKHYLLIYNLANAEINKQIDLPHKIVARKTYLGIKFFKEKSKLKKQLEYDFVIGDINFDNIGTISTKIISSDEVVYGEGVLYLDYNKVSTDAIWRTRRNGDMFAKFGTGSKKLNDYFTDKKLDIDLRDRVPVLAVDNHVLVVLGDDISENVKIDADTDKIIAIKFNKLV